MAAMASEDAFDAAVSALVMAGSSASIARLPDVSDPQHRLEGLIWHPGLARDGISGAPDFLDR